MHAHSHITRAVAAMDSCFALVRPHTILAEKALLLYTFYSKKVPLSQSYVRKSCSHFHVVP